MINKEQLKPISAGLGNFIGRWTINMGGLFAANIIAVIPTVILFLIFQRYFIEAFSGSLEG